MNVSVELSRQSFLEAANAIREYADGLEAKCEELCRRLAQIGVSAAVANVRRESGDLASSIRMEKDGERDYLVVADSGYAVYVEFGTGVVGTGAVYQGTRPDWATEPGSRTTKAREDGSWVYYDEKSGSFKTTRGQVPNGFMGAGSEAMRQAVMRTAREVIG